MPDRDGDFMQFHLEQTGVIPRRSEREDGMAAQRWTRTRETRLDASTDTHTDQAFGS
jgi:hypothetical protein